MMHQPFIGERFSGDSGSAHYSGSTGERKLAVRRCASLQDATMFTTSPLLMNTDDRAAFNRVEAEVRLTRYGGDCYSYCMLAAGHLDLVIETELKPYDIAALIPIITGAGGVVTTWEGRPAQNGGRIIAAGDRRVHEAEMKLLARCTPFLTRSPTKKPAAGDPAAGCFAKANQARATARGRQAASRCRPSTR